MENIETHYLICLWFCVQVPATLIKDLHPPNTSHKLLSKVLCVHILCWILILDLV